ncbi:MAG: aldehyde dehydrogenase family protein [Pseudomonadota bacterium]
MYFDPRTLERPEGVFVGGALKQAKGDPFPHLCPSDTTLSLAYPTATASDVDQAVEMAPEALRASGWAELGAKARGRALLRWADLITAHAEDLAALEAVSSSRAYKEVLARDVQVAAATLRNFVAYAETQESAVTETAANQLSLVTTEPHGVVAAIAPWNFPLILSSWKFAPALAAGNAVLLKPSELTPFSALRLAELSLEAGLPPGLFSVLPGGAEVGRAMVTHPGVDYVTFTGSSATGAAIMADAAHHGLKPVSLELGGKGAQLVFDDAPNLSKVADLVARGVIMNAGQVCFAGSRLVVHAAVKDQLLAEIADRMKDVEIGPTWSDRTTLAPIINSTQINRIEGIVNDASAQGAVRLLGGERLDAPNINAFAPTILDDVRPGNPAFDQEVFGPVLSVDTFEDFEQGVAKANHPEYGLATAVHTKSLDRAMLAARKIESGTVWINHWGRGEDMTSPFGGVKRSGIGKDLGRAGYEKYLKSKSVWVELGDPS